MKNQTPIRVAFVGAGHWMESHHLPVLERLKERWGIEYVGIWNRTREKAERLAQRFGIPKVYPSLEDLAADPVPNCRVVVVDKSAVCSVLLTLNQRPLPFLCEKPPGESAEEANLLAETVRSPHVVAFNRRYAPLYEKLKAFLKQREGPPYWMECSFYRRRREDPRMVVESGIHGINFLEYLWGPIREVQPLSIPGGTPEPKIALVEFSSQTRGLLKFFPNAGKAIEWYEIQGQRYSAYLRMAQPFLDEGIETLTLCQDDKGPEGGPAIEELEGDSVDPLHRQGFVGEYEEFFRIVRDPSATSRSTLRDAFFSLRVAEAIERGVHARWDTIVPRSRFERPT